MPRRRPEPRDRSRSLNEKLPLTHAPPLISILTIARSSFLILPAIRSWSKNSPYFHCPVASRKSPRRGRHSQNISSTTTRPHLTSTTTRLHFRSCRSRSLPTSCCFRAARNSKPRGPELIETLGSRQRQTLQQHLTTTMQKTSVTQSYCLPRRQFAFADPIRLRRKQQTIRCAPLLRHTMTGLDRSTTREVPVLRPLPSRETLPTSTLTGVRTHCWASRSAHLRAANASVAPSATANRAVSASTAMTSSHSDASWPNLGSSNCRSCRSQVTLCLTELKPAPFYHPSICKESCR